jgi:hypothetical protein
MSDAIQNGLQEEVNSSVTGTFTVLGLMGAEKKHSCAYEKVFMEPECRKIEIIEKKLQNMEEYFYIWVRDARRLVKKKGQNPEAEKIQDIGAEKNIYIDEHPMSIRLNKSTTIDEIRQQIQEKYSIFGSFSMSKEGPLNLMFEGKILLGGSVFGDYLSDKQEGKRKWAKPYVGVVWIVPFRSFPKLNKKWKGDYALSELSNSTNTA